MTFLPSEPSLAPVWDSNTDEVVHVVEDLASGSGVAGTTGVVVVPVQCTYMLFSIAIDAVSGVSLVFISSDVADVNSGIPLENGAGGSRWFGTPVTPGTELYLHTSGVGSEAVVNITRFYTKK